MTGSADERLPRSGAWLAVAAAALIANGALAMAIVLADTRGGAGTLLVTGLAALSLLAGVGVLRRDERARPLAVLLASAALLLQDGPTLVASAASGTAAGASLLGAACDAVVLFAVLWRWPATSPEVQ